MTPIEMYIAKPCDQSWSAMKGDEKVRHCQSCRKNVYNLGEMSEAEIAELITKTDGKFCGRLYRRSDNRMMTHDCPKGVARIRRGMAVAFATSCTVAIYAFSMFRTPKTFVEAKAQVKASEPIQKITKRIDPPVRLIVGSIAPPDVRLGQISVIPKRPKK